MVGTLERAHSRSTAQMSTETVVAVVVAVGLLVYLVYTLLRPEKF
jgi:K+-transporting ATPase KdpF subunit